MPLVVDAPAVPAQDRLTVGDWTVEPDLNQLSAQGKTVKVEPKAMAVLLHLASRPGQVVGRDALFSQVWPGVMVGDDSLTQVVIKLRKALGDDPDRPTYIQTVTKRGYRLVAPVQRVAEAGASSIRRRSRVHWFAVALALVVVIGSWLETERPARRNPPDADFASDATQPPTLAITPFEALSKDPQEVLLARGITADLLTDLSKSSGLAVMGFSPMDGRALGEVSNRGESRYFVSGTVERIDERLRLTIFLTERATGRQIWSERFDRPLTDLFTIQDELGPRIVRVLPAKVNEAELRRMARRHTRNLQAYEYFQRGQAALLVRQKSGNEDARRMFQRALALDATFARAYSGLALTHAADYRNRWIPNGPAALERAFQLARTAIEINPDVPETYWALAYVHEQRREHAQALKYLEKSLSLYPSFSDGYALMASIRTYAGQPAMAVPLMRTAMRLNPRSGYLYFLVLGRAYFFLGNLEQARINLEEALRRNPEYLETHIYVAALSVVSGDKSSGAWEADQIRTLEPGFSANRWLDNYPMTDNVQRAKLLQALDLLSL